MPRFRRTALLCTLPLLPSLAIAAAVPAADTCHVDEAAPVATVPVQVRDAAGALIPLAVVTLRCGAHTHTAQTDAAGAASVRLHPGTYAVTAAAAGFAPLAQPTLPVAAGAPLALTLQLGSATDVINVTASTGFVPYDSNAGSKTNSPLIEVPQSISIVNALEMTSRQIITMNEALRYTPGVTADEYGVENRFDWLKIRGFDAQTFGVYRDGMRFNSLAGKLDPFELESVEILKGPSSVLYGEVPPGGLINQVTKRPAAERSTTLEAQFGSYSRRQGALDTTGSFDAAQKFRYRLLGLVRNSDTQVNYTPDNRRLIAPSFTWRPGDRTGFTILADYQYDGTKWSQFLPSSGTLFSNPNGVIPVSAFVGEPGYDFVTRVQSSAGYTGDHLFTDGWNLHSNYRFQYINFKGQTLFGAGFDGNSTTNVAREYFATPNRNRYNTTDNRALRRFNTGGAVEQTVLLGYDYQHIDQAAQSYFLFGVSDLNIYHPVYGQFTPPTGAPYLNNNNLLQQHGLYAQDQLKFKRHLVVTVGGRQDFAKNDITDFTQYHNNFSHLDERFTGRIGATYLTDSGIAPYVAYSTSFLPNAGTYVYNATTGLSTTPAKPSDARQVEAGVKIQPRSGNSFITASFFNITETNVLVADSAYNQHQDGEVRSRGFELEGVASLSRGLNLHAGYTLAATNVNSAPEAPYSVGHWLPQTPRNQVSALADYTQRGGRFAGVGGNFGVRFIGANLSSDPASTAAIGSAGNNSFYVPNYALLDAGVRFGFRHTLFSVNATNLTDKRYVATCTGLSYCYYGYARNVLGSAKYRF